MITIETKVRISLDSDGILRKLQAASQQAREKATVHLARAVKTSIGKRRGRLKKYDMDIYDGNNKPVEKVKDYLKKPKRKNERVMIYSGYGKGKKLAKGSVKELQTQGVYRYGKGAPAGHVPYSWPHDATTQYGRTRPWPDYWLRNSIKFDKPSGTVYSDPAHAARALPMPKLIEEGGTSVYNKRHVAGYYIMEKHFKNGSIHVNYKEVAKGKTVRKHFAPRPFMRPAAEKQKANIRKMFAESIEKKLK
jgi:hypothetical protein